MLSRIFRAIWPPRSPQSSPFNGLESVKAELFSKIQGAAPADTPALVDAMLRVESAVVGPERFAKLERDMLGMRVELDHLDEFLKVKFAEHGLVN